MDTSINLKILNDIALKKISSKDVEDKNLYEGHSYLILKTAKVKESYFFLLRNPHGKTVWNGRYSDNSPLWTQELRERLGNKHKNGAFWMIDDDFFEYFTTINILKPSNPFWHVRYCKCTLGESPTTLAEKAKDMNLQNYKNITFRLIKPIPEGAKCRFRIFIEKKFDDFINNRQYINNMITIARSNGRKLSSDVLSSSEFITFGIYKTTTYYSCRISNIDDIFTFVIHYDKPTTVTQNFYIRVFCEYDFKLYDNDSPEKLYPLGENPVAVFDNFTFSDPFKNLPLHPEYFNHNDVLWFRYPALRDFDANRNQSISKIINKNSNQTTHYCHFGPQIDLNSFISTKKTINFGRYLIVYSITDKITGKLRAALSSRLSLDNLGERFSKELLILQELKYPSIIEFIGYSETNFKNKQNPVFITEFCSNGSLLNCLEKSENDDSIILNNTSKMIILIGVACAMRYIHQKNIIHYDLKCSGVFLDDDFYPKVGDFGQARHSNFGPRKIDREEKPYCIAPELINQSDKCSFPVDVFAYGMLFYHVVSNKMPTIHHLNISELHKKIRNGERPDLSCIPLKFHDFVNKLWNENPSSRPSFSEIVDLLINDKNLWLDEADENEINKMISVYQNTDLE